MRHALAILLFLLLAQNASAARGERILEAVREGYREYPVWTVSFRHSFYWEMTGEEVVEEGRLLLAGEKVFRVEVGAQRLLARDGALWRWQEGGEQVLLESLENDPDVILPQQLLVDLESHFRPGEAQKQEDGSVRLPLEPRGDSEFMSSIELLADKDGREWVVRQLAFVDIQGNRHRYELLERQPFESLEALPEGQAAGLEFTLPPGMDLIDLRP